ncbi:extracellular matrix structural constituent [Fragilaria crotonensis]|nr:extracellular matrix structural constituent [Fragilaria crotonensis]
MQLFASFLFAAGLSASLVTAQLPSPVQTYFVPLPEDDLIALFKEMSAGVVPPASGNVNTVISIAIASDNTIVYYDHWEDGFETDARLKTQPTTLIWGDGNLLNGVAPGTLDDKLKGGTAIVLSNNVPVPRVKANIFFDGSDRIQSSLPVAVTRFAYPDAPGSLMAGAGSLQCQFLGTKVHCPSWRYDF